jgi:hypothetical protein
MDSTLNQQKPGRGDENLACLEEQLSKLAQNTARQDPLPLMNAFRPTVSGDRSWPGVWARRGFIGFLLAACVGVAAFTWWQSYYDGAAKTATPQPAPLALTAPTAAAVSPELAQVLQSVAHDLAIVGQGLEQLRASREEMTRDNATLAEGFKASQEQMVRFIEKVSEQLKGIQAQMARDNANVAEQFKASQEQLARIVAQVSEQSARPKIAASPPRPTATPPPKPERTLASPHATAQAGKPKLSSASRPPVPVR